MILLFLKPVENISGLDYVLNNSVQDRKGKMDQGLRIVLASEHPEMRYLLKKIITEESGNVIIGQAENVPRTMTLTRNMRPEMAIIDSNLPHAIGIDGIPLSRAGGLDAAQAISEELPGVRVVLVNNLDSQVLSRAGTDSTEPGYFSMRINGAAKPILLRELNREAQPGRGPVFVELGFVQQTFLQRNLSSLSDTALITGGFATAIGLSLNISSFETTIGLATVIVGIFVLTAGMAGKLTFKLKDKKQ